MRVLTILGTRPEIIRLGPTIERLDEVCDHIVVHTGQNYDPRLSEIFFSEMGIRQPQINLQIRTNSFGTQIGEVLAKTEAVLLDLNPSRLLLLGDTNSALSSIVAKRLGIPVYHMEAGNRCFDDRVPEEVNRKVIDHCSTVLLPYTNRSKENLIREGISGNQIFVTGNPIYEVLSRYRPKINESQTMDLLHLRAKKYFLATFHRQENVDIEPRLRGIVTGLTALRQEYGFPVVCSVHPRTAGRLREFGVQADDLLLTEPLGFFDFVNLEQNAFCVLTDSGTVQEECCILKTRVVTMRDTTERPETIECGSNCLSGVDPERIRRAVKVVTATESTWTPPSEYLKNDVSGTITRILTS